MFKFIEELVESAVDIVDDITDFQAPQKSDITKLLAAGVSAVVVSEMLDVGLDVVKKIAGDSE